MSTKEKVEAARSQAIIDLHDRIISMKAAIGDLENLGYAMKTGRIDALDYRVSDIIDDPSLDRIRAFASDPEIVETMRVGRI